MKPTQETDLYEPVKLWFEERGFEVKGEVNHCDIVARKDQRYIAVELKTSANMTLLVQATSRQRTLDEVYVAVPQPKHSKRWLAVQRVIRQLGLGLLIVKDSSLGVSVQEKFAPGDYKPGKNSRGRKKLVNEFERRRSTSNVGGSTKQKITTVYREEAILIACFLDALGPTDTRTLRKLGCCDDTTKILYRNVYGWFDRESKGVYKLTRLGKKEARMFPDAWKTAKEQVLRG